MEANVKLGRIWGIPIGLHWSWFLVFVLVTSSLAAGYFPAEYPALSVSAYWLLGALTSILFFGSVLIHELAHAYLALRNRIPVKAITLFIFGGVAQISREPDTAGGEFRIAIAGPLASLALAVVFGALWMLDQAIPYLAAPSIWLARINLILAVFNMIPAFPLDGGRVLRALIWQFTGSPYRATRIATTMGQLAAFGFMGLGAFTVLSGNFFNGLWFVFIGWFLQNAATAAWTQTSMQESLRGVRVGQVMSPGHPRVPSWLPLTQLIEERVLAGSGQRTFFVSDNGHPSGILTLRDVTSVPRTNWAEITAEQVMVPFDQLVHVHADTELIDALRMMDDADVAQLPVVEDGDVVGVLSREQVLHYIRVRAELGA